MSSEVCLSSVSQMASRGLGAGDALYTSEAGTPLARPDDLVLASAPTWGWRLLTHSHSGGIGGTATRYEAEGAGSVEDLLD